MSEYVKSYWLSTVDLTPGESLEGTRRTDVAIIGSGFAGLSSAYELKQAQTELDIIILESHVVGYGASGRNAGFVMPLFGFTMETTQKLFGKHRIIEAQEFMEKAVDCVGELVRTHDIDCDYEERDLMTVALSQSGVRRLQREIRLANSLGFKKIYYIAEAETRARVNSPTYLGARIEEKCALINPAKLSLGMKRVVESLGVKIYERSPVLRVRLLKEKPIEITTDRGQVLAERVVLATNAFSVHFPQIRSKQVPVGTYIVLTEPLTEHELAPIGWRGREGIEDARNLVHYYRLTADNRLLMGGGDVGLSFGRNLPPDESEHIWGELKAHILRTFPSLRDVKLSHRWGGPVSVPTDFAPAIGYFGKDKRAVYVLGCVGHGVAHTNLAGKIVTDLLLNRNSYWSNLFFVNRFVVPWPPEPLRIIGGAIIRGCMRMQDERVERSKKC